jgi:hypothetical protein
MLIAYVVASSTAVALGVVLFAQDPAREPGRTVLALVILTLALGGFAAGVLAGWVSAHSPVRHALAVAAILVLASGIAAVIGAGREPAWFRILAVGVEALALPVGALVGARHRTRHARAGAVVHRERRRGGRNPAAGFTR